jgi:AcrR family transcriptional regulator
MARKAPARKAKTTRRERGSISAREIVTGALKLAGEEGIDALSMPRLARSLDIGVTSIYWYFTNKDALIDAITVEAAGQLDRLIAPDKGTSWQQHLRELYLRLRNALRENDLLCDLLFMRGHRLNENALLQLWPDMEETITKLVNAGFTPKTGLQYMVILSLYTRGCVVLERQMRQVGVAASQPAPVSADFPILAEAARQHNLRGVDEAAFHAQLDLMIRSMEDHLAATGTAVQ